MLSHKSREIKEPKEGDIINISLLEAIEMFIMGFIKFKNISFIPIDDPNTLIEITVSIDYHGYLMKLKEDRK